jgi:hypothetical protein
MHKALIGLAVAATLGLATVAAPSAANARCFGCAVGVGVLGGVVAGLRLSAAAPRLPAAGRIWATAGPVCPARPGLLLEQAAQGLDRGLRLAVAPSPDLPVTLDGS